MRYQRIIRCNVVVAITRTCNDIPVLCVSSRMPAMPVSHTESTLSTRTTQGLHTHKGKRAEDHHVSLLQYLRVSGPGNLSVNGSPFTIRTDNESSIL
jgi:hypothetical protein